MVQTENDARHPTYNGHHGPITVDGVVFGIPEVPDSMAPLPHDLPSKIRDPGLPRATKAVSIEKPEGNLDSPDNRTVMQQHVDFFDFNKDGIIYPKDTYTGFRKIGFNVLLSAYAVFVIHGTFSYPSQPGWLPDPLFSLRTDRIHRCKHGSDSEVYDHVGRYRPAKYEELFAKFDTEKKGGLYYRDILRMWWHNLDVWDPVGWTAGFLEWGALWLVAADEKGLVTKETVRAQYDGSLFYQLARKNEARKSERHKKKQHGH